MTTIIDVAKKANVSTTTVSHVINGTRPVHPKTEKAVREAIEALGYIPNALARALTGAKQQIIGVMISALNNHYFHQTLHWIDKTCHKHQLMTIYADHQDSPEHELHLVQSLHQRRVDGILLAPSGHSKKTLSYLKKHRIPTVLLDRFSGDAFDGVGTENQLATQQLVEHLFSHGYQRIAYLKGRPHVSTTKERLNGFMQAHQQRGVIVDNNLILAGHASRDIAYQQVSQLLIDCKTALPEAIFAGNNLMTIGALKALREHHIRIPDEIALVGFDDFDWAALFEPRLTLIAQPIQAIGEQAVALLLNRIENPDSKCQIEQIAPQLKIRQSCGCRG